MEVFGVIGNVLFYVDTYGLLRTAIKLFFILCWLRQVDNHAVQVLIT
jgi:hypothetical protein